jgi:hypothetical protein
MIHHAIELATDPLPNGLSPILRDSLTDALGSAMLKYTHEYITFEFIL